MTNDPKFKGFLKQVGANVRKLRTAKGWTLEATEEHGWNDWRQLQKIEAGKNITLATLWNVAKLLKVHPSELM